MIGKIWTYFHHCVGDSKKKELLEKLTLTRMTVYDFTYIDEKIIGGVEKNLPAVADIIKYIEKRATGKVTSALSMNSS